MKSILLAWTILTGVNTCNDFEVIKATEQQWAGGISGSGGGTDYQITIVVKISSNELEIDGLWIGERFFPVKAKKKFPARTSDGFSVNDTIYITTQEVNPRIEILTDQNKKEQPRHGGAKQDKVKPPIVFNGAALISYTFKGKRYYKEVSELEKLKFNARP